MNFELEWNGLADLLVDNWDPIKEELDNHGVVSELRVGGGIPEPWQIVVLDEVA